MPDVRLGWPEFFRHAAQSFDRMCGTTEQSLYALAGAGVVASKRPAASIAAVADLFLEQNEDPLDPLQFQIVRLDSADQWCKPAGRRWHVLDIVRTYTAWVAYYNRME